ncbi:MAG TPA: MBL fold metallo-hydrolase [Terriglobales bacterium]|nr:MBL fold metallo-hydrolase [Terriglobales bacterium]
MHRTTLGDFELTILSDGLYHADGGAMFGVVPRIMWEKRVTPDERNTIPLGLNSLLVRTGRENVLIETGIGSKLSDKMLAIYRSEALLLQSFEQASVSPDEIDIVINTHLHFDHCGWNTYYDSSGKPAPTFPRATYYVQRGELEHAHEQHERDRISYISDNYDPLIASGQMKLLEGDTEIVPGISVQRCPGHTRDHQGVFIRSGGRVAAYPGDLLCDSKHLDPVWVLGFDLYPLESIANKHRFYQRAIPEQWLVVFTHDHELPWAHLTMGEKGRPVVHRAKPKVD